MVLFRCISAFVASIIACYSLDTPVGGYNYAAAAPDELFASFAWVYLALLAALESDLPTVAFSGLLTCFYSAAAVVNLALDPVAEVVVGAPC